MPAFLRFPLRQLALLALAFVVAGCDSGGDEDLVGGVDFDRLFAPPTAAEVDAVWAEWQQRADYAYAAEDVVVEAEADVLGDGSRVVVLSHTMSSTAGDAVSLFTHYGAVRFPAGEAPAGGWPVLVVNHGGDDGFSLEETLAYAAGAFAGLGEATVTVFPSFRSEEMRDAPGGPYTSGGPPSPWDRDVDDALGLLNAALQTYGDQLDASRIGTVGVSRGGGVSLLMAARPLASGYDLDAVTEYFGPTDFFTTSIRFIALTLLTGTPAEQEAVRQVPGVRYLEERVLDPLAAGQLSYEAARRELVRRSAASFAERLPATQAHHHRRDGVVPFDQFEALQARAAEIGGATDFNAYGEPGELSPLYHSISQSAMPGNHEDTVAFLQAHLLGAR